MSKTTPVRSLLIWAAIGVPLAVLVFLIASRFFVAWDGHAVGMRGIGCACTRIREAATWR